MIRHMSYTQFRKMKPYMSARDLREIRPLSISPDEIFRSCNHDLAHKGLLSQLSAATCRTEARKVLDVIQWFVRKLSKRKPTEALKLAQATTDFLRSAPVAVSLAERHEMQARVRALKELPDCF
jgi:hypothetical protein